MTEKNKNKYDWIFRGFVMLVLSAALAGAIKWIPKVEKAIESKTFSSPESKVMTEKFMLDWGESQDLKDLREHVNSPTVHMPKHIKDSVYVTRAEFEEFMKNMAIDNWNQKKAMDEMNEKTEKMMRMMNIILSNQDFNK